MQTKIFQQTL